MKEETRKEEKKKLKVESWGSPPDAPVKCHVMLYIDEQFGMNWIELDDIRANQRRKRGKRRKRRKRKRNEGVPSKIGKCEQGESVLCMTESCD